MKERGRGYSLKAEAGSWNGLYLYVVLCFYLRKGNSIFTGWGAEAIRRKTKDGKRKDTLMSQKGWDQQRRDSIAFDTDNSETKEMYKLLGQKEGNWRNIHFLSEVGAELAWYGTVCQYICQYHRISGEIELSSQYKVWVHIYFPMFDSVHAWAVHLLIF